MNKLRCQPDHPPRVPPLVPRGPTLIIGPNRQQCQKRTLLLCLFTRLVYTNNKFVVIIISIEFFDHFESRIFNVFIDDLVLFVCYVVNDEVFA